MHGQEAESRGTSIKQIEFKSISNAHFLMSMCGEWVVYVTLAGQCGFWCAGWKETRRAHVEMRDEADFIGRKTLSKLEVVSEPSAVGITCSPLA